MMDRPSNAYVDTLALMSVEAIFDDLRDRRFLKWLFSPSGDATVIDTLKNGGDLRGLDLETQSQIKAAWQVIVAKALTAWGDAARYATPRPNVQDLIERLTSAIEGECDGLAIDEEQGRAILEHVLEGWDNIGWSRLENTKRAQPAAQMLFALKQCHEAMHQATSVLTWNDSQKMEDAMALVREAVNTAEPGFYR